MQTNDSYELVLFNESFRVVTTGSLTELQVIVSVTYDSKFTRKYHCDVDFRSMKLLYLLTDY